MRNFVFFLGAALLLSACEVEQTIGPAADASIGTIPSFRFSTPPEAEEALLHLSTDERRARSRAMMVTAVNLAKATAAPSWPEAEQGVQAVLAERDPLAPAYFVEQYAAVLMLGQQLLTAEDTALEAERLALIGSYTERLAAYESPETGLALRALEALEPAWSVDQRAEVARRLATAATAQLADKVDCEGCPFEEVMQRIHRADAGMGLQVDLALEQDAQAIEPLWAIARAADSTN